MNSRLPPSKFQLEMRRKRISFHMNEGENFLRTEQWESAEKSFKLAMNDLSDVNVFEDDNLENWDCYLGLVEAMIHLQRCPQRRILVRGLLEDLVKIEGSKAWDIRRKLHWVYIVHKVLAANIATLGGKMTKEDLEDIDVLAAKAMEAMEQASINVEKNGGDPECSLLSSEAAPLLSKIMESRGDSSNARFYRSLVIAGFVSTIDRKRLCTESRIETSSQPSTNNTDLVKSKESRETSSPCEQCVDAGEESCDPKK